MADHVSIAYRRVGESTEYRAVDDATFDVKDGELVSLIGPSGCGKSSLLGAVAGLIEFDGRLEVNGSQVVKPGLDRGVVFQSPSLLPWRTVLRNVSYGLELRGVRKKEALAAAAEALELVGLSDFHDRYPSQLSGGMQQRVNLARAFAGKPRVLLLDEPFSAVDAQTRERLQLEIASIWERNRVSGIFVTHQIDEAVFLSHRVVVMAPGPSSSVIGTVDIDLGWPRNDDTRTRDVFLEYVTELRKMLYSGRVSRDIEQATRPRHQPKTARQEN